MNAAEGDRIRVVIADDQALIRSGFELIVDDADDMDVVGTCADGAEAVAEVSRSLPDVVLMDIRMPTLNGIDATARIAQDPALAGVRVLVLTTFDTDTHVYDALRAGASGFLLKDTEPTELLDAIRVIAAGDALLSPSVTRRLIAQIAGNAGRPVEPAPILDALTPREAEVTALVARGLSNDDISAELHISVATAKTHVARSMTKLHARDRAQLVTIAYESGLVTPGDG